MAQSKSKVSSRAQSEPDYDEASLIWRRIGWVVLAAGWLFCLVSMASFDAADAPTHSVWPANDEAANACGPVGAHVSYHLFRTLGVGAWLLLGLTGFALWNSMRGLPTAFVGVRLIGVGAVLIAFAGVVNLILPNAGPMPDLAGGLVGLVAKAELATRFGGIGAFLALTVLFLIGMLIAYDRQLFAAVAWVREVLSEQLAPAAQSAASSAAGATAHGATGFFGRVGGAITGAAGKARRIRVQLNDLDEAVEVDAEALEAAEESERQTRRATKKRVKVRPEPMVVEEEDEYEDEEEYEEDEDGAVTVDEDEDGEYEEDEYEDYEEGEYEDEDAEEEDALPGAPQVFDKDALREKMESLPIVFNRDKRTATDDDLRDLQGVTELEGYKFPGMDLLEEPEENFTERLENVVREQAEALEAALQQYKIDGEVVGVESGPVITLYHVKLAPGTRVSTLQQVSSDLARALKSVNIRIVPNQEGRDTVGVEVPNPAKEKVRLKELMADRERSSKMRLPMFLGKDASGEPLIADLTKMPHMLIAGTTGSGKSVCMNTIIMSFLYTKKPNELKLVLVDPKMVEMSQFKDIPHLMCPVVTEMQKAAAILEWAVRKMDERYELLAEAGCRDIAGYNELDWEELKERFTPRDGTLSDEEANRIPRKLPYMVFIIDELADLMMTNKEVEGSIVRIAQKARAVGMHLILATQRPQANVVTGLIKSNMPCRVAFKVASGMDSRIVLDQKGGELLLGQGDMLYLSPSSHKLSRAQGTLVDDSEIRRVARFMRDVAGPTFEKQLVQIRSGDADEERLVASENNSSASLEAAQEDPLFNRAVEIVLETKRGSVSLIQRRLAIGYTRASRLIDLMGIAGIIGEHKGSVAREVMISPEEWAAMQEMHAEELARQEGRGVNADPAGGDPASPGVVAEAPPTDIDIAPDAPVALFDAEADRAAAAAVATNGNIDVVEEEEAEAAPFEPTSSAEDDDDTPDDDDGEDDSGEDEDEDDQDVDGLTEDDEDEEEYESEEEDDADADEEEDEAEDEDEDEEDEEEDEDEEIVNAADEEEDDEEEEVVYVDEDGNELTPEEVAELEAEDIEDEEEEDDEEAEDEAEDEYEVVYVDEDGNELTPEEVAELEAEDVEEEEDEEDPAVAEIKPARLRKPA